MSIVTTCDICGTVEGCYPHKNENGEPIHSCYECENTPPFNEAMGLVQCNECGNWFTQDTIEDHYKTITESQLLALKISRKISGGEHQIKRGEKMRVDIDKTTALTEKSLSELQIKVRELIGVEKKTLNEIERLSTNISESTLELEPSLKKFETVINLEKLEQTVALLKRAEKLILTISHLKETGMLEKIANILK